MATLSTDEQLFHSAFNKNVKELESARKKVNSQINNYLRKDDDHSVAIYTNIYLLIYSAWTEANLVKLIHTPFGFTEDEKKYILKDRDVLNRWKKCVNMAFSKFEQKGSEIPNKKKEIYRLLDDYLKNQANVRNKIAHGQWAYPLYSNNMAHDEDSLTLISLIDVIQVDTWFKLFVELIEIVKGLIDSRPKNDRLAHYNHYYTRLTNMQLIINKRKNWSLEEKKRKLKLKPIR